MDCEAFTEVLGSPLPEKWVISTGLTDKQLPFTSIQFPLYEGLKSLMSLHLLDGRRPSPTEAAVCGSFAGAVAAVSTTPLDVVKTRVMLEARAAHSASPSVLSFPPRLLGILRNEGPAALFSGWVPRTTAIALGGAVFLGIYDFAVHFGLNA
jgi:solute carrier family 25 S-adenosylmethionine transporter 26